MTELNTEELTGDCNECGSPFENAMKLEMTHHNFDVTGKFQCDKCGSKYEAYFNKVGWRLI
jgi:DNA-directed RNA polymerase subunit M/transcription elongation factor TFIIS